MANDQNVVSCHGEVHFQDVDTQAKRVRKTRQRVLWPKSSRAAVALYFNGVGRQRYQ